MTIQQLQQLPHRPIVRDRVAHGLEAAEPEPPLLVADHDAPLAGGIAVGVLHVVMPRAICFPNIDRHAGYGPAVGVLDGAHGQHGLAGRVRRHARPIGQHRSVVRVERTEHGAFGTPWGFRVVDVVDQQRQAENIG